MSATLRASAVICTLDRGEDVVRAVASLRAQRFSAADFEVLIVDNGSSPACAAVLRALVTDDLPAVRYVREDRVGESSARNAAIEAARGEVLAFLDDDAIADPDWLTALVEAFDADRRLGAAGGPVALRYEVPPPAWVDAELTPYLSGFDAGTAAVRLAYPDYPRGANMAFRRAVFAAAGRFSERFGRRGDCLLSYSEIEMCYRVERAGWAVGYAPEARVEHVVSAARLRPEWFAERIYWQGRSLGLFERVHFGWGRVLSRVPGQLLGMLKKRGAHRRVHWGYLVGGLRG